MKFFNSKCLTNLSNYSTTLNILFIAHMYSSDRFEYFAKNGFEKEAVMLDKQMIPHFKALDVCFKICQ